jgi:hypothetical protein
MELSFFVWVLNQSSSPQSLETLTYNGAAAKSPFGYLKQTIMIFN